MFNTAKIKRINALSILQLFRSDEIFTKQKIAKQTGLSVSTCSTVIKELLEENEILPAGDAISTGGRPSKQYVINKNHTQILMIYFRKEADYLSINLQIRNSVGETVFEKFAASDYIRVVEIIEAIDGALKDYPNIRIISLGVPGVVKKGSIDVCDIETLQNTDLKYIVEHKYNIKCIVENDVNTTALGYYRNHLKCLSFCYIYFPLNSNPGSGFIINDKIYHGCSYFAGEVSYMPLGYSRDEQKILQKDAGKFIDFVTKIINTIDCTINPNTIVISSYALEEDMIEAIRRNRLNQEGSIIFEIDINEYYLDGLFHNGIHRLDEL